MELHEIEVDGRPVRYRVMDTGKEPLVVVHGLAGSWRWWSPMFQSLAERRRVYAVDLPRPRRGVRPRELSAWLGHWLDAVGLKSVDIAGHSLGGLVAAELAADQWERTRRLVLVAPAGIPCGRSIPGRALPLLGELYDIRGSLPMIAADALRTGPFAVARGVALLSKSDLRNELRTVRAPTLLVWGERDRLVPVRIADEWHRMLPNSRLAQLACGHVPMLEAPHELAACMLSFLDEERKDDLGDQVRTRVVDGVRLAGHDDEPAAR
jgi:pimeloyl-ACP methyl ester carboxylesterase